MAPGRTEDTRVPVRPGAAEGRLAWAAIALAALVLATPALVVALPPLTDYPNHLARLWLLSGDAAAASVARFYRVQFDTVTNIGIDLLALTVGRWAGFEAAGRLSLILSVVLPFLGGALLSRAAFGRLHWWALGFGLLAWGQTMLMAFLNFQIAIGLGLIFAALDPAVQTRPSIARIAIRAGFGLLTLLMHPFGLLFYALVIGALLLGPRFPGWSMAAWTPWVRRYVTALIGPGLVVALFVLSTPQLPGAEERSGLSTLAKEFWSGWAEFMANKSWKAANSFFALRSYSNRFDVLTGLVLLAPIAFAAVTGRLRIHAGLAGLAIALLVAFLLCPEALLGAEWVSVRFAVMFAFTTLAALLPSLPGKIGGVAAAALALTLGGRTAAVGSIWLQRQGDVAAVRNALDAAFEGAAILPLEYQPGLKRDLPEGRFTVLGEPTYRHLAALALPLRHAYIPTFFAARGKQPIVVPEPWIEISEPDGGQLADIHALDANPPANVLRKLPRYLAFWQTRFDYILLLGADMPDRYGPFVPPVSLSLVRDTGFARLYRIERTP